MAMYSTATRTFGLQFFCYLFMARLDLEADEMRKQH